MNKFSSEWEEQVLAHSVSQGDSDLKDRDIIPTHQFVMGPKLYIVKMTRIMEVGYMDILTQDEDGTSVGKMALSDY